MSSRKHKKRPLPSISEPSDDTVSSIKVRGCDQLFAFALTIQCAVRSNCVPCAYKLANFDVALDVSFCKQIPNQRPELCPRSQCDDRAPHIPKPVLGYTNGMTILTVGDGDFSFSVALARFGCNVTATSYESKETLLEVYSSVGIQQNLSELQRRGCCIAYNVDAVNLKDTLPKSLTTRKFHRIVWNFPCTAIAKGQDGQNQEMDRNKELIRKFVENARLYLHPHGQIHMNHKTKPPFNQWKIDDVVVSTGSDMRFLGRVVLDRHLFPPYTPRKALDRKSFPCHDACTYVFEVGSKRDSNQTTKHDLAGSSSLSATDLTDATLVDGMTPEELVSITPSLILSIRSSLLNQGGKNHSRKRTRVEARKPESSLCR